MQRWFTVSPQPNGSSIVKWHVGDYDRNVVNSIWYGHSDYADARAAGCMGIKEERRGVQLFDSFEINSSGKSFEISWFDSAGNVFFKEDGFHTVVMANTCAIGDYQYLERKAAKLKESKRKEAEADIQNSIRELLDDNIHRSRQELDLPFDQAFPDDSEEVNSRFKDREWDEDPNNPQRVRETVDLNQLPWEGESSFPAYVFETFDEKWRKGISKFLPEDDHVGA